MSVHNSAQILKPPSQKQLNNEEALKVYAVFLAGLVILGVVAHGVRRYPNKDVPPTVSKDLRSLNFKAVQLSSKLARQRIDLGWLGRLPYGLVALVSIFLVVNIVLCSTILPGHRMNFWASRLGWMAAANMVLCVSMAVKNTPLALISTISHAQLNIIHRIVGYTTVFMVILHAILYTAFFGQDGRWATLLKPSNLAGIGAGIAMIVLLMGFFRHRGYTVFYISHFLGFSVLVVLVWLHRPDWAKKLPYVAVISGCIWMLDRSIRMCTLGYNIVNNTATLFSLPDGGTRILLRKPIAPAGTLAGLHYYLWLPRFRFWTAHPFTVVNNGPFGVELVMKSHEGFTKYVGDFAIQFSGCLTWASMHGPYGCQPDVESYDRVVFICGGSGGAFMFGLLNYMMNRPDSLKGQQVQAIWAVRREEHLTWFNDHLHALTKFQGCIEVTLFVTDAVSGLSHTSSPPRTSGLEELGMDVESGLICNTTSPNYETISKVDATVTYDAIPHDFSIAFEKMKIDEVVEMALEGTGTHEHILVATCGPTSLMDTVKSSAEFWRDRKGLHIDVHSEDFNI